jgi:hypothetical protein
MALFICSETADFLHCSNPDGGALLKKTLVFPSALLYAVSIPLFSEYVNKNLQEPMGFVDLLLIFSDVLSGSFYACQSSGLSFYALGCSP